MTTITDVSRKAQVSTTTVSHGDQWDSARAPNN